MSGCIAPFIAVEFPVPLLVGSVCEQIWAGRASTIFTRCVLSKIFSPKAAATTYVLTTRLTTLHCWNRFQARRCVCNVSSFEYTTCRPPQTSSPYLLLYRQQDVYPVKQPHRSFLICVPLHPSAQQHFSPSLISVKIRTLS